MGIKTSFFLAFCIDKADELPVHNRKGVGNQKEKGGGKFIEALKG
jgi:hypothetical protein